MENFHDESEDVGDSSDQPKAVDEAARTITDIRSTSDSCKSGGPRTDRGKVASAKNSTKHAIGSLNPVAGGESLDEWDDFYSAIRDRFQPQDVIQEELVRDIALTLWRRRRVIPAERSAIDAQQSRLDEWEAEEPTVFADTDYQSALDVFGCDLGDVVWILDIAGSSDIEEAISAKDLLSAIFLIREHVPWFTSEMVDKVVGDSEPTTLVLRSILLEVERRAEDGLSVILNRIVRLPRLEIAARKEAELARSRKRRPHDRVAYLPPGAELDRLVKYEAHLDRRLKRSLEDLELLQRASSGELIEAPLRIHGVEGSN